MIYIAQNEGKKFEQDFKASVPDTCWIYRLRDNASSFAGGNNTRFTSTNICDYIVLDDKSRALFLFELKSVKSTSIPFSLVRKNQLDGLLKANKHNLFAGIITNFRNKNNDTYFVSIDKFKNLMDFSNKKSFNIKDLETIQAIKIKSSKKRTRYNYDINSLIKEVVNNDRF